MSGEVGDIFARVAALGRITGGCDDCDAYQEMRQEAPGVLVLGVFHDAGCPTLERRPVS